MIFYLIPFKFVTYDIILIVIASEWKTGVYVCV